MSCIEHITLLLEHLDEVESIRFFDEHTQKTTVPADSVSIVPASDILFTEEQTAEIREKAEALLKERNDPALRATVESDLELIGHMIREARFYPYAALLEHAAGLWDYMDHPIVIISNEQAVYESAKRLRDETVSYIQEMVQEGKLLPKYVMWHDPMHIAPGCVQIAEDPLGENTSGIEELHIPNESLPLKLKLLQERKRVLFCLKEQDAGRLIDACIENKYRYRREHTSFSERAGHYKYYHKIKH